MKKLTALLFIVIILFSSCAETETYTFGTFGKDDYSVINAEPYGWIDKDECKNPNIKYKICGQNIFWSIVLFQTVFSPILLTGFQLYEPVGLKSCAPNCDVQTK